MSTHIVGYISEDNEIYQQHKQVLLACINAKIKKLPDETALFFNCNSVEMYLLTEKLQIKIPFNIIESENSTDYEVLVSEIPKETFKIVFFNSY